MNPTALRIGSKLKIPPKSIAKASANGNGSANGDGAERVAAVISECTQTITREVAGLKAMVDEFSRFARLPATRLESANLNEVISQAVGLYKDRLDGVSINLHLDSDLPLATLDGCPLGLSLIAARGNDTLLLELAARLMR